MSRLISKNRLIRNISVTALLCLVTMQIICKTFCAEVFCADLIAASSLLLMFPLSFEDPAKSLPFVLAQAGVYVVVAISPLFKGRECMLFFFLAIGGVFAYTIYRAGQRYENVRTLFRTDSVWCDVENFSRMLYMLVFGILGFFALTASRYEAPAWVFVVLVVMLLSFFALCYYCSYTGRTMLLDKGREKEIRRIINGHLRGATDNSAPDDHMSAIYTKVIKLFESKKPYLNEDFSLEELSREVFTNKVYLSKAINYYSGRNFRQFINYYRVMYACDIMKQDRRLRVTELAMMCGFHSLVTFNMAFKLYMNMTPGAYYGVLSARDKGLPVASTPPSATLGVPALGVSTPMGSATTTPLGTLDPSTFSKHALTENKD